VLPVCQFQELVDPTFDDVEAAVPKRGLGEIVPERRLHGCFCGHRANGLQQPFVTLGKLAAEFPASA
jgi:hypothetical protein